MTFLEQLEQFFSARGFRRGDRIIVGFSGGIDSTALLWGLARLREGRGFEPKALHVEHGMDGDAGRRAAAARHLAAEIGAPLTVLRLTVPRLAHPGESLEAAARRIRYAALERHRRQVGAVCVATGHHADDQIETVLLRLLFGSGLAGLEGIQVQRGFILRPFLEMRRSDLREVVAGAGLQPVCDPSNFCLDRPRNRIRLLIWPRLERRDPDLATGVVALAAAARGARARVEDLLRRQLELQETAGGAVIRCSKFAHLPPELSPWGLSLLGRQAGLSQPPSRSAQSELRRQLIAGKGVGCDCGAGWRWESQGELLRLLRPEARTPAFAYTVKVPGECEIPELSLNFRIHRGPVAPWMFRRSSWRAGMKLPLRSGDSVVVRNRRAGDRLQPLGCDSTRRLKNVLMGRRIPRRQRDRLPLLEVGSQLAWVPGVTVDHRFRLDRSSGAAWIAELESL